MKKEYYAIFEKEQNTCYAGYCPDYPGVMSSGNSLSEAKQELIEAIEFYLEDNSAAAASTLEAVENFKYDKAAANTTRIIIQIEVSVSNPTHRINVTIDEETLHIIDDYVSTHKAGSRSNFLAQAALNYIHIN